jgi:Homing endonuclease associated repeat
VRSALSKEELISAIRACAGKLGRAPTLRELLAGTKKKITRYDIGHRFGGYTKALRACGLNTTGSGRIAELRDMFLDWAAVTRSLGRVPTIADYDRLGRYSVRPLLNRFGNWTSVPGGLESYAEQNGWSAEWADVLRVASLHRRQHEKQDHKSGDDEPAVKTPRVRSDRPVLGPPMLPTALTHSPTNESGVVYLFGAMAGELGFAVTHIQTGFPDCEAVRRIEKDRWQRVRIEFEYESRNFLKHLHRTADCDVIVCWIHNWPACPLEVVELRSVVRGGLPGQRAG